ncbi:MAG: hypothetical protein AAGB31_00735 [Bdellovibrio sp.]
MKIRSTMMIALFGLFMAACSHTAHKHENCQCGHNKEQKKECAGGECPVDKKCADCQK